MNQTQINNKFDDLVIELEKIKRESFAIWLNRETKDNTNNYDKFFRLAKDLHRVISDM